MARNKTTFQKGQGKALGTKANKTKLKEVLGLDSWDSLQKYLIEEGKDNWITQHRSLKGKAYVDAYLQALEYFKPKLARIDSNVNIQADIKNFIIELTNDEANSQTDKGV